MADESRKQNAISMREKYSNLTPEKRKQYIKTNTISRGKRKAAQQESFHGNLIRRRNL